MNEITPQLNRLQKTSLAMGIGFLVLAGIGLALNPSDFYVAWLVGFIFWLGLGIGCLNAAMIFYLTGGRWGFVSARLLEAAYMTLPLMAVLFIPLLFGLHELYPWARPEEVSADKILRQKTVYENFPGYLVRAIVFFGAWVLIASRLRRWSLQQDQTTSTAPTVKLRTLSGPGVVLVPFLITFAFVDWIMSIEPAWFSTIFAVILMAGQMLAAFAFVIIWLGWLHQKAPYRENVTPEHFHNLGNLLLTFVMFWTYVAFSQLLIIYAGNEPHEIAWYLHRIAGHWKWVVGIITVFHFFVPFFLLLFRAVKKSARRLVALAVMIFLVHAVELFWAIAPSFKLSFNLCWISAAAWLGMGGLWLVVFIHNLKRHPLLPLNLPLPGNPFAQPADAN